MTAAITINNDFRSQELVAEWIKFADVAERTQKNYNGALKQFFKFIAENQIVNPTRDTVIGFRDELLKTQKSNTVQLKMAAIKLFFKFLELKGIYKNIAVNVKSPKVSTDHKRDALKAEDAKQVINNIDTSSSKGKRDKAIVTLMMICGLRSCEVVRANIGDLVNTCGKLFLHVHGKNRSDKSDMVAIPAAVENLIRDYLSTRDDINDDSPLFTSTSNRNHRQRLQTQTISRMTKAAFKANGFNSSRLTCHSCRHTAALTMLMNNVSLLKIQMILRHKQISTTQIYLNHLDRLNNDGEEVAAAAIL